MCSLSLSANCSTMLMSLLPHQREALLSTLHSNTNITKWNNVSDKKIHKVATIANKCN